MYLYFILLSSGLLILCIRFEQIQIVLIPVWDPKNKFSKNLLSLLFITHTSYKSGTEKGVVWFCAGRDTAGKGFEMLYYDYDFWTGFGIENGVLTVAIACKELSNSPDRLA